MPIGLGAALPAKSKQESKATYREFMNGRQARAGNGDDGLQDKPVITPHTPARYRAQTSLANLNPAMLLDPRRGVANKPVGRRSSITGPSAMGSDEMLISGCSPQATSTPQFLFSSANDPAALTEPNREQVGSGSLIERMHNLNERVDHPFKRIKRSTSPCSSDFTRAASSSSAGRRCGLGIADHFKEKQEELASKNGSTAAMVDLTLDEGLTKTEKRQPAEAQQIDLTEDVEEDRPSTMISGRKTYTYDPDEREVCYGRIEGARIGAFRVPDPKKPISSKAEWPPMAVRLQHSTGSKNWFIKTYDPAGNDFGNIDPKTAYGVKDLMASPIYRLRFEARTDVRPKGPFEAPGQPTSTNIVVHINVFGPFKYAVNPVGKIMGQRNVWLRTPKNLPHNRELFNPHCNDHQLARQASKAAGKALGAVSSIGSGYRMRTVEEAQREVNSLFDDLQKTEELPRIEPNSDVTSELLDHQKQALAWMVDRETPKAYEEIDATKGSLWRCRRQNGKLVYHNVVTGHEIMERPQDLLGGILADMMGLGKTLSLLALLSYTKTQAAAFAEHGPKANSIDSRPELRNLKTTLIVCPLSVISNWEDQISQHIKEDGLRYYIFHGSNRSRDLAFLSQFDVILTTYQIVKSEFFPANKAVKVFDSAFAQINFFRVVLDEAHYIRSEHTQQFKAALRISATRRWCLTATPIQNRLDDLGALLRFLQYKPFDQPAAFNQFILAPFKTADPEVIPRLRILVDCITLRRLKDKINLLPRVDEVVKLSFSKEEQVLYDFFATDASKRINAMTANQTGKAKLAGKGYMNILRSILCLRQISAHGKELLRDEDIRLMEGHSISNAIDIEEEDTRPMLDERQAYSMFDLLKETNQATCAKCASAIGNSVRESEEDDQVIGTMLPCYQLICNECVKLIKKTAMEKESEGENRMVCPFCEQAWRISLFEITVAGITRAEQLKEELRSEPRKAKVLSRYDGPHTKTTALISRLQEAVSESEGLVAIGEPPIKSIVFSAWVSHLDLIGIALDACHIEYTSLVGSMSRKQRRAALDHFRGSPDTNVLLVSIGTGGVGLNLTAASRVYLMDISFNPMAEQQAIDRVHRLGQKREVIFTRFLMSGSIEEKIMDLQKRKMDLADLSLQRGKIDKAEAARKRLEDLKGLFK